jgi:hypothetical protein
VSRKRNDTGKFTQKDEQPREHVMRLTNDEKKVIEELRSKDEDQRFGRDNDGHL